MTSTIDIIRPYIPSLSTFLTVSRATAKVLTIAFAAIGCFATALAYYGTRPAKKFNEPCHFCNPKVIEKIKVYENKHATVICTNKPEVINGSHFLIIPKNHVKALHLLNQEEWTSIHQALQVVVKATEKAFGTSSYKIEQKNGLELLQNVEHIHIHVLSVKKDDKYAALSLLYRSLIKYFLNPQPPQLVQKTVEKMKAAVKSVEAEVFPA